ncbi:hypothetical protein AAHA92_33664 [Salvia divinorum]|uniref:DUF7812 domain-containing protein n=1 Tax=Salvia divinorum TaxID=28513 RepID=A0ABD1FSD2_SALDI
MSRLQTNGWGSTLISSDGFIHPPFESYISTKTKEKLNALISGLDRPSHEVLDSSFSRMKSDLVGTSLRFLKDCQNAYTVSCQEEILAVLSCLVLKASESYNDKSTRPVEGATLQHLYLLASLLKLMSVSLIQAIQCVRHSNVKACLLTNLALLNLFVLEEGNLDAVHLLVDSSGEYFSSEFPVVRFSETEFDQSSSLVIASRFHKMRSLHSSVVGNKHNEKESLWLETLAEEETEETCSGEIFLKCMLPGSKQWRIQNPETEGAEF